MMTLANKIVTGLTGLTMLVSGFGLSQKAVAGWKPNLKIGLDLEANTSFGICPIQVQAPGSSYIPLRDYSYVAPEHILFETGSAAVSGIGPKIRFTLFGPKSKELGALEFSARHNLGLTSDGNLLKLWDAQLDDGYRYSCIGTVDMKKDKWSYGVTVISPPIFRGEEFMTNGGVRLFASYQKTGFKLNYYSRYKAYEQMSLYPVNFFDVGHFDVHGARIGLSFTHVDPGNPVEYSIRVFYQRNFFKGDLNEEAKGTVVDKGDGAIGAGISLMF